MGSTSGLDAPILPEVADATEVAESKPEGEQASSRDADWLAEQQTIVGIHRFTPSM